MRTRIFQFVGVAAIASLTLTSCDTDLCKDVNCGTNGTCVEGDCVCDDGYEGTNCETEERAKFVSSYSVSEACTSGNYTYSITGSNSSTDVTKIIISNFGNYGVDVVASVDGSSLTIANQTVGGGTFSGSGQLAGNVLTLTYNVTAGTSTDSCTMTCTKQ